MSWLSELFGGGGGEDPLAVQQRQQAEFQKQLAAQQAASQAQLQQLLQTQQGGSTDLVATPTSNLAAINAVKGAFPGDFEFSSLPSTYDDPLIEQVYGEQRQKAQDYIDNLFKRNVITGTGKSAAERGIQDQSSRVRTQLGDIGDLVLAGGRQSLSDIADRASKTAAELDPSAAFDINPYLSERDQALSGFTSAFPDRFRANITGDLFDTANLANIAGAAQGATNLAFDPFAVAGGGVPSTTDETEDQTGGGTGGSQKKRASTVF